MSNFLLSVSAICSGSSILMYLNNFNIVVAMYMTLIGCFSWMVYNQFYKKKVGN